MDGKRFDSLARTVGRRRSRRDAFQALAAAGLAAAAARLRLGTEPAAEAQVTVERRFNCAAVGKSAKAMTRTAARAVAKALGQRGVRKQAEPQRQEQVRRPRSGGLHGRSGHVRLSGRESPVGAGQAGDA